eukprot:gene7481-8310_t
MICFVINRFTVETNNSDEPEKVVRVPAYLLARRDVKIPLLTKIYVDTKAETIIISEESNELNQARQEDEFPNALDEPSTYGKGLEKDAGRELNPKKSSIVNVYIWDEICGDDLESLKNYPLFPKIPYKIQTNDDLVMPNYGTNIGVLVIGYLASKCDGYYQFEFSSFAGGAELWVSTNEKPKDLILLKPSLKLKELFLERNKKYFFAFIYKVGATEASIHISITNKNSACNADAKVEFYPYTTPTSKANGGALDIDFPWTSCQLPQFYKGNDVDKKRRQIYTLPFISEKDVTGLFPICKSAPEYVINRSMGKYDGVWETKYSAIYPSDESNITEILQSGKKQVIFGNDILSEKLAVHISHLVMLAIEKKHPGKYELESILNVEKNPDTEAGARYLVELELRIIKSGRLVRFSEYVSKPKFGDKLCLPENFRWNKKAMVNVILTVGGQGRWAKHFIQSINQIYKETRDGNINLIIVDFNSKDINLKKELESTSIPHYVLLNRNGGFYKSEAIQQAANTVLDPNGILLLMDLHLLMPLDFIDIVRKHCVQGKMTFNPVLARLRCGAHCKNPLGFWEIAGYGIFATYKSDWDVFGGMNYEKFKNRWGGEDWEMLDRVLMKNYEVERLKVKNFFHNFHTKKGMWNAFKT